MMSILESNEIAEEKETTSAASEYSAPARAVRWFVVHFFKLIEGVIRLFMLIFYGLKTVVVLVFRFFWPYPLIFRRHK